MRILVNDVQDEILLPVIVEVARQWLINAVRNRDRFALGEVPRTIAQKHRNLLGYPRIADGDVHEDVILAVAVEVGYQQWRGRRTADIGLYYRKITFAIAEQNIWS